MTLFKKINLKSKILYLFVTLLSFQGCNAQDKKNEKDIEEIQKSAIGYTDKVSYTGNVDFKMAAKIATPGVVNIKSTVIPQNHQNENNDQSDFYNMPEAFKEFFKNDPFFREFKFDRNYDSEPVIGGASGVILTPDGYIVTNNHVVKDADEIDVTLYNGKSYKAKVIGTDPCATTRSGLLTAPLRARFGINSRLGYYDSKLLKRIVERSASILNVPIDEMAAFEIARRSRGTPRIANALLRRVRDFAQIKGNGTIDVEIAQYGLAALNVDKNGLDEMDIRILSALIDKFKGGPVGITTISTAVGEEAGTIEEVYEPFLIQEGYLIRTPRGRQATHMAYKHLGKTPQAQKGSLFDDEL